MTARTNDDVDVETGEDDPERYVEVRLEDSGVLIYDTENESAWIQSASARDLDSAV